MNGFTTPARTRQSGIRCLVTLRPFRRSDAASLPALYRAAAMELGAQNYDARQCVAWANAAPSSDQYIRRAEGSHDVWIAEAEGHPVAYADLEPDGHLDHLYCAPKFAGRGVGAALVLTLEAVARSRGLPQLHVEASEAARPVFSRLGWTCGYQRDLTVAGVAIHNYRMTRTVLPAVCHASPTPATTAFFDVFRNSTGVAGGHQVVAFGDTPTMMDELVKLALEGTKRATAGLLRDFAGGEPMPFVGGHVVLVDGRGAPCAVWRTGEVRIGPLVDVDEAFAWDEGEGERTRDDWLAMHRRYFSRVAARDGFDMHDHIPTVFERFEIVWPGSGG
ncbi:MAG: GNAT family N-acetyltransferase [Jannaschia sp.]